MSGVDIGVVPEDTVAVSRPIRFSVMDPLGGSGVASPTVYIYDGQQLVETLSGDASGLATSTLDYSSGKVLNVKVVASGYVTRWNTITVPRMNPADVQALSYNSISLTTYNLGTFAISVMDGDGNSYATTDAINMTDYSTTPMQLTVTVRNTEDNSGWISSYDPISKVNLNMALLASTSSTYMTIQNAGQYVPRGTVSNYVQTLSDDMISKHFVGGVYLKPGQQSFTVTLYRGSLTSAANQTVTFDVYSYFDAAYFAQQGIGGPDAATAASQFSLTFYTA